MRVPRVEPAMEQPQVGRAGRELEEAEGGAEGGEAAVQVEGSGPGAGFMARATSPFRVLRSTGFPTMAKAPTARAWRAISCSIHPVTTTTGTAGWCWRK